jgi:hypothetical protein
MTYHGESLPEYKVDPPELPPWDCEACCTRCSVEKCFGPSDDPRHDVCDCDCHRGGPDERPEDTMEESHEPRYAPGPEE